MNDSLNNKQSLKSKSKLLGLLIALNKSSKKRIKLKEGSSLLKYTKKYKNHFDQLLNDKPIKKIDFTDRKVSRTESNTIDNSIISGISSSRPYLYIKRVDSNEVDRCIFCMNSFDDLEKHLKEEIKK